MGREDLIEKQFEQPGSDAHAEVERIFLERSRDEWQQFASSTTAASSRCSTSTRRSTPSSCARARWWWSSTSPGTDGVRQLGVPVKLSRTPGEVRAPGPVLGEHTREVLASLGYDDEDVAALEESGAVAGPAADTRGSFMS